MKIHEYQGKELFRRFGIPVPVGEPALSIDDALAAVPRVQRQSGVDVVVVKAQIHAGGRGKGGGVKVGKTRDEAEKAIRAIFGMQLVTQQTGPEGQKVQRLLVEQGLAIEQEFYLAITARPGGRPRHRHGVGRRRHGHRGGRGQAPGEDPQRGARPGARLPGLPGRKLGFRLGLKAKQVAEFSRMMASLSRMFDEMDCAAGRGQSRSSC